MQTFPWGGWVIKAAKSSVKEERGEVLGANPCQQCIQLNNEKGKTVGIVVQR